MTPREKFIMALEGKQPPGRVPHWELVFYLTMEAFGRQSLAGASRATSLRPAESFEDIRPVRASST